MFQKNKSDIYSKVRAEFVRFNSTKMGKVIDNFVERFDVPLVVLEVKIEGQNWLSELELGPVLKWLY